MMHFGAKNQAHLLPDAERMRYVLRMNSKTYEVIWHIVVLISNCAITKLRQSVNPERFVFIYLKVSFNNK